MDYTRSDSFVTDAATGKRMHVANQAVPTAVSDADMNSLLWSLMAVVEDAGLAGVPFAKDNPASYQVLRNALRAMGRVGTLAFTGTATYTAAATPAPTALASGLRLRGQFAGAGGAAPTLNVGGLGAKAIKQYDSSGAKVPAVIVAGQLGDVEYDGTDWVLLDPLTPSLAALATTASVNALGLQLAPPGAVLHFARSTAPTGWLKANGAAVSRTTYAALFSVIETTFGAGDGSTTFALPDLRGEFLRGWDDGRGVDVGRTFAVPQSDLMGAHTHGAFRVSLGDGGANGTQINGSVFALKYIQPFQLIGTASNGSGITTEGGVENRPRNIALLACIKY